MNNSQAFALTDMLLVAGAILVEPDGVGSVQCPALAQTPTFTISAIEAAVALEGSSLVNFGFMFMGNSVLWTGMRFDDAPPCRYYFESIGRNSGPGC